ncbi:hypothetical protein GOY07_02425 [Wolbachia endosymbiont of Litomosoides sigmodontis]|uniref:hypothetical protein n=1 Tax=Wolbachia endosymbiont of Litomosoides sigmodontis TaxID=80850 RepID=UPI00158CA87D|nr:hypothetical protein [Wolbachia endosymbiont of Litomosoides sigmodontis]QKX03048.1 hypothetical protein GOY07_02425 [Wolbachia endosymbiont of Litomosoides sigmodontis]
MVKRILRNWLGITELQKSQKIDAEQFQAVSSALKEWQEVQKVDTEQLQSIQKYLNGLQKKCISLEEKVGTLTETVEEKEKIMLTCCIVVSVVTLATISFIAFCIYQGVKSEKEKQKSPSDRSSTKFDELNVPGTKLYADISSTAKFMNGMLMQ